MGISPARLNNLRRRGEIPAQRAGWRGWRFRKDAEQAPLVRMCNAILVKAIEGRASDIPIEPDRNNVRVRIRVDGEMRPLMTLPKHLQRPVVSRYKVMADLDRGPRRHGCGARRRAGGGERTRDRAASARRTLAGFGVSEANIRRAVIGLVPQRMAPRLCDVCQNRGYRGAIGLFEVVGGTAEPHLASGSLFRDAEGKLRAGLITVEGVQRALRGFPGADGPD